MPFKCEIFRNHVTEYMPVGRVRALVVRPDVKRRLPVVIFAHGATGSKEGSLGYLHHLADAGFFAVAIDAWLHGQRRDQKLFEKLMKRWGEFVNVTGRETAADLRALVSRLVRRPDVDPKRIGLMGSSMGGYIGFVTMVLEPRIRAFACVVSTGNLIALAEHRSTRKRPLSARVRRELAEIDLARNVSRVAPRPILLLAGAKDKVIPARFTRMSYRTLLPHYRDRSRLRLIVYPKIAHAFTETMEREAHRWLANHL